MHPLLEKHLGKILSAAEVAEYFDCSLVTVYRNYRAFGGVRIGSSYKFFEQRIINAVLGQTEAEVDCSSVFSGQKVSVLLSEKNRCCKVGSQNETGKRKLPVQAADPHGLLA